MYSKTVNSLCCLASLLRVSAMEMICKKVFQIFFCCFCCLEHSNQSKRSKDKKFNDSRWPTLSKSHFAQNEENANVEEESLPRTVWNHSSEGQCQKKENLWLFVGNQNEKGLIGQSLIGVVWQGPRQGVGIGAGGGKGDFFFLSVWQPADAHVYNRASLQCNVS